MLLEDDTHSLTICDGRADRLIDLLGDGQQTVVILRGVSGAGKSTVAEELSRRFPARVHSTDSFHLEDGEYRFKPERLREFHAANQQAFAGSVKEQVQVVVCDNTNLARWEYEPYVDLARRGGYRIAIVLVEADPQKAAQRNLHGVPAAKVLEMHQRLER